jgi:hypothetical protein
MLLPRPVAFGLALVIVAALAASPAHAGLIPTVVTVTPDQGNYRWTYTVVLPSYSSLHPGNYFVIYDFNGLIPSAAGAPTGWSLSTPMIAPTLANVNIPDNPEIPDLVWTYNGPATQTGRVQLGDFWVMSQSGSAEEGLFVGRTARSWDGKYDTNVTGTLVPAPVSTSTSGVPEPRALVLASVGLSVLGMVWRFQRRS